MKTTDISTLKINKLTQEQYDAAVVAGTINENELYMTPDNNELDTHQFLRVTDTGSAVDVNPINADMLGGIDASEYLTTEDKTELNNSISSLANTVNSKAPLASPTFTGTAKATGNTNYTTAQLRNITISTEDPSGGSNGDIWIKYTE